MDRTGLTGTYDFNLEYDHGDNPGLAVDSDPIPTIYQALGKIGLKLEPKKAAFDVLVIDHADKAPTEN